MGVSKNRGTPKWMIYNGKIIKMDDLGVPLFLETSIYYVHEGALKTQTGCLGYMWDKLPVYVGLLNAIKL